MLQLDIPAIRQSGRSVSKLDLLSSTAVKHLGYLATCFYPRPNMMS